MELKSFQIDTVEIAEKTPGIKTMVIKVWSVLAEDAAGAVSRFMSDENAGALVDEFDIGVDAFLIDVRLTDGKP